MSGRTLSRRADIVLTLALGVWVVAVPIVVIGGACVGEPRAPWGAVGFAAWCVYMLSWAGPIPLAMAWLERHGWRGGGR